MHDEKMLPARSDPLRYIDARFEPRDPVFDAEDPIFCERPPACRARRRPRTAGAPSGDRWPSSDPFCAMVRPMPARQLWAFLTERDVEELLAQIAAREPGLVTSQGRYLRGDARALLDDPSALERRESVSGERRTYLFHRKHSAEIVTHVQPEGPFGGWAQIDEERTDCLVLLRKDARPGELEPARLYAHVTYWRAADKARKRPMFSIWAGQTLKWLASQLRPSSSKMIRIGPDALKRATAGELRLTYLYRTIAPEPEAPP
ncbi:MAG TPA: hypothetical protein VFL36_22685 [Myxococcales bacterium]|nr:hypothetical protein [Myxococcales bacterium]